MTKARLEDLADQYVHAVATVDVRNMARLYKLIPPRDLPFVQAKLDIWHRERSGRVVSARRSDEELSP